jgi:hypothetical protein
LLGYILFVTYCYRYDVDDEALTALVAEEVYLGLPCPEEAQQALQKDLGEVNAELLVAEAKAAEKEQLKSAKQQKEKQVLGSPGTPVSVRVRGRKKKPVSDVMSDV